jgi:hypothetical protein
LKEYSRPVSGFAVRAHGSPVSEVFNSLDAVSDYLVTPGSACIANKAYTAGTGRMRFGYLLSIRFF